MGMNVENGKLSLKKQEKCIPTMQCSKIKCSKLQQSIKEQSQSQTQIPFNQNSYIYNKYFKNQNQFVQEQVPLTKEQLIQKLIHDKIQRQRIRDMKSTKLIMPTENIHFAPEQNFNHLFGFSKK
jgi:hypothetical protein